MARKLVIDRRVWYRGKSGFASKLLLAPKVPGEQRQQCCVGIYLTACGVPDSIIEDKAIACRLEIPEEARWLVEYASLDSGFGSSDDARKMYNINDNPGMTDRERELQLAAYFHSHGVEVEFGN